MLIIITCEVPSIPDPLSSLMLSPVGSSVFVRLLSPRVFAGVVRDGTVTVNGGTHTPVRTTGSLVGRGVVDHHLLRVSVREGRNPSRRRRLYGTWVCVDGSLTSCSILRFYSVALTVKSPWVKTSTDRREGKWCPFSVGGLRLAQWIEFGEFVLNLWWWTGSVDVSNLHHLRVI